MFRKISISALVSVLLTLLFVSTAQAQTTTCYTISLTVTNGTANPTPEISIQFTNGNPINNEPLIRGPQVASGVSVPAQSVEVITFEAEWNLVPDGYLMLTQLDNAVSFRSTPFSECPEEPVVEESAPPVYTLPGVRTQTQQGFIITPSTSSSGDDSVQIWVVDDNGNGVPGVILTQEQLEALPTSPAANTEIASGDGFAFYVLTTGEFQINYGPTADGWVDVIVFDRDFNVTNEYRYSTIPR